MSRRDFLRRSALLGGAAAAGPWLWRQMAVAADAPISQVHLTYGRDAARSMVVSWMTPTKVDAPFVEMAGHRFAARSTAYAGYPGIFHHAALEDLGPNTPYTYRVGHAGAARTEPTPLRTAPRGRAAFTFTAFGDQGTNGVGLGQPPRQPGANTELAMSLDPAFHLIVGDLAYANGDQAIWDTWFTMIEPMAKTKPWMPIMGNHEIESQISQIAGQDGDSWGKWGYDPYRTRFQLPSNGHDDLANCFYSFRYGGVQFINIDNNDVNDEVTPNIGYTKGRQQAFVARELAAARHDPSVDFIVVQMHQCAFSSSTKHGADEGVRKAWFDLFRTHSVDLVLQGHDHTYERTHAMDHDKVVGEGPVYRTDAGTVYVVCGNGGAVQEPLLPIKPESTAFRQDFKVGTLAVQVEPDAANGMKRLTLTERWALDGSVIDGAVVLERPKTGKEPEGVAGVPSNPQVKPQSQFFAMDAGPAGITLAADHGESTLRTVSAAERAESLRA